MRILYIHCGLVPPPEDPRLDRFQHLSEAISGTVLLPVWWRNLSDAPDRPGTPWSLERHVGHFSYHLFPSGIHQTIVQKLRILLFFLTKGWAVHRRERFDCIITYGHSLTALAGAILKLLTRTPLIIEVNCEPHRAALYHEPRHGTGVRLRQWCSIGALYITGLAANHFRLLYPTQLARFPVLRKKPFSVIHDFVPMSMITPCRQKGQYVAFVGHPWYLKGLDILLRAFPTVRAQHPGLRLMVIGYLPNKAAVMELAGDCEGVDFLGPLPFLESVACVSAAIALVHPSRTEGMPRVLLEAMAAGTPVVATEVGGIPYYVSNGVNGVLFPSEDVEALVRQLCTVIDDAERWEDVAHSAVVTAHERWSERVYVRSVTAMVQEVMRALPHAHE